MAIMAARTERRGEVGWIKIRPVQELIEEMWSAGADELVEIHTADALGLQEFRSDPDIRVVVITGEVDGEFHVPPLAESYYENQEHHDRLNPLKRGAHRNDSFVNPNQYLQRTKRVPLPPYAIETLVMMEKPVIARVNGDAIGFGQALLWGCDIIVAREDAIISDLHMSLGGVIDHRGERRGPPWGVSPGDGAMAFWPLFLPPTKAKEYMLLSRALTAKELADMNIVNYAVPMSELDRVCDEIIGQILSRPQHALERTKRLANKALIQQWNLTQDLAWAYEHWDFLSHALEGHMQTSWRPPKPEGRT